MFSVSALRRPPASLPRATRHPRPRQATTVQFPPPPCFTLFPKKRKLNASRGQETAAAPPRAGAPVPRVCPKGMAAALLQALLAVAGAPSPSRNGRATIARRRSVSGIRRPACGLHSRARHGTGGLRRGHARGQVRTSSATSSGRTSPPPYARSSSTPATSTHKVFPASLLFPSLPFPSLPFLQILSGMLNA